MSVLLEDLVAEILSRMPVKSLMRLRCLCKSWNHFIQSSNFIKKHLIHHSTRKECILISHFPEDGFIHTLSLHSYDFLSLVSPELQIPYKDIIFDPIEIYGPCNGLICISINKQDIMLCNPFLREFKLLKPRPFPSPPGKYWFNEAIGFGYDSLTKNYKVVRIAKLGLTASIVEVYDLSEHSWRKLEDDMLLEKHQLHLSSATNFNEMIHWVNCNKEIISFNVKTEVFQSLMLPPNPWDEGGKHMSLTVLNEFLGVFAWTDAIDYTEQFIELWKMEDYRIEETWIKLFTIGPLTGIQAPLLLWKDEGIILERIDELSLGEDHPHPPGKLYTCLVATQKIEDLQMKGKSGSFRVMICNESLISLD